MNILVFNCGSSSLKYRLIAFPAETEIAAGEAQRVGPATAESSRIYHRVGGGEQKVHYADMPNHGAAFKEVMHLLEEAGLKPDALGHRTVHGGTRFTQPTRMNPEAVQRLEALNNLAPLHNPPTLNLMHSCSMQYPDLPQVAVFDTAFHATIPEEAYTYAIPEKLRERHGLRKYGFHGTSHRFVVEEAARILNKPLNTLNVVSCHLGSGGASLCAVKNGRSVDNTMGFSPLQGLIMSTRCGDIDPALTLSLLISEKGGESAVEKVLNTRSGVLGLSGTSGDIRDILTTDDPDESVRDTAAAYIWRIRKYLGAYLTVIGQPDAVIFTDTVGEQVPDVREKVCRDLTCFGLQLDTGKNRTATTLPCDIAAPESRMHILVIQTNEELAIARETYQLLQQPINTSPEKESEDEKLTA
ncbi:acetate/propionate family kinase [Pontiella agarivorans]|uniref:Acetate kinase n=1 Tax=Pontiella agarivorans TaxID=3038953 RepID=A0ABU5MZ96_9BACT|nr:acetate/propionate family kinase [Pontiella agarivorans]MDZ8119512.1 acetate/propionate family kinase [Pontiella agarivorans]